MKPYTERLEAWKHVLDILLDAVDAVPPTVEQPRPWSDDAVDFLFQLSKVVHKVQECIAVTEANCRLTGELLLLRVDDDLPVSFCIDSFAHARHGLCPGRGDP